MRAASTGRTHGRSDQACDVKKVLANTEPSTHGTDRPFAALRRFRLESEGAQT
jgi:hypothetical protein